ncbi:MAG: heme a synthase [Thermoleophilaceae bacterium]|nr:heme a synthase [Thermoleophilaceae bacterium]MEA2349891.1 heme a synthase [Thermoleophilaceae bacterium]MEA2368401.1 heme a synthase [Thermoleophilaceae bacterium]MEA2388434.1 heme a synthase [Thermoleophilaceae bacterium]
MTVPSPAYRRLALWTAAATFLLIVLGGIVRVSDSGLGCGPGGSGVNGWPLCRGDVVPGFSLHTAIEYAHRTVASIVVVEMLVLAVWAWRRFRGHRALVRAATAGVVLIVAQALLGAATVEQDLDEPLVAAHLGLAMLLFAVVLYVVRATRPDEPAADASPGFRRHALATQALLFGAIVAGGYMAGTERLGASDQHVADGAHHACGTQFPGCNGGFLPFGANRYVDIHLTHRVFVYLFSLAVIALIVMALRRRMGGGVTRAAWALGGLLVVQIALGAVNVWLAKEYELLILAHLATATLLWGTLTVLNLQLFRIPAPAPEGARRVQAVTA